MKSSFEWNNPTIRILLWTSFQLFSFSPVSRLNVRWDQFHEWSTTTATTNKTSLSTSKTFLPHSTYNFKLQSYTSKHWTPCIANTDHPGTGAVERRQSQVFGHQGHQATRSRHNQSFRINFHTCIHHPRRHWRRDPTSTSHATVIGDKGQMEGWQTPGTLGKMSILYGIHAIILGCCDMGSFDFFRHL